MTNVRPGDIAIVVGCPACQFNGATCEVVSRTTQEVPSEYAFSGAYWWVRFGRPMPWLAWAGNMDLVGTEGAFPDQFLRKISGPRPTEVSFQQKLLDLAEVLEEIA